jgi:hypothetical protein
VRPCHTNINARGEPVGIDEERNYAHDVPSAAGRPQFNRKSIMEKLLRQQNRFRVSSKPGSSPTGLQGLAGICNPARAAILQEVADRQKLAVGGVESNYIHYCKLYLFIL